MHIPLNLSLFWVVFSSMLFWPGVDGISFSAASGFEKVPATSVAIDDSRSLFMITCEISPSAS